MADQERFTDPAEIRHLIGATGTFSLHNVSGSIRLRGGQTDEVVVNARSNGDARDFLPLIVRRTEGGLHIEIEQKSTEVFGRAFGRGRDSVEFDVMLPAAARVDVTAVSADVEAHGLSGEQSYKTVSGDLSVDGHGGRLAATTVSGDISVKSDQPLEPSLRTTSGDIKVVAPLIAALEIRSVSGDALLDAGFAVGPVHSVESVSGDLRVATTAGLSIEVKRGLDMGAGDGRQLVAGDGSAQLRFRSLSGDVRLDGAASRKLDSLGVLRALERGDIDIEEATRRLEGAGSHG